MQKPKCAKDKKKQEAVTSKTLNLREPKKREKSDQKIREKREPKKKDKKREKGTKEKKKQHQISSIGIKCLDHV